VGELKNSPTSFLLSMADRASKNLRRAIALNRVDEVAKQLETEGATFNVPYPTKDLELKAVTQIEKAVEVIEYLMAKRAVPGKPVSAGKSDEKSVVKTQKEAVTKKEKE
jgi:hypothetical protein